MASSEDSDNDRLREASGSVRSGSKLVSFLYQLMRDHLTPGQVEEISPLRLMRSSGFTFPE